MSLNSVSIDHFSFSIANYPISGLNGFQSDGRSPVHQSAIRNRQLAMIPVPNQRPCLRMSNERFGGIFSLFIGLFRQDRGLSGVKVSDQQSNKEPGNTFGFATPSSNFR